MPTSRSTWLAIVALGGFTLVLYRGPVFSGETFTQRDHQTFTLPSRAYFADALRQGRLPQWTDAVGLGTDFAADPNNSATYPLTWMFAPLPAPIAADALLIFHVFLAGVGAALLSRRFGASPAGMIMAGASLMACGYVTSMVVNDIALLTAAWTPWVAWATVGLARANTPRAAAREGAILAAVLALQIMSGEPSHLVNSALLSGALILVCATRRKIALPVFAAAACGAVALAATTVLPALFLLADSSRAHGIDFDIGRIWSLHPLRMLEWIWPGALGDPIWPLRNVARVAANSSFGGAKDPTWAFSEYMGLPVLVLAVIAAGARIPGARTLLALSLVFVLLALGSFTPVYGAYRWFFFPEQFLRYPEKHITATLVLWSALGGVGLSHVFDGKPHRRALMGATAAAGALVLLVAGAAFLRGPLIDVLTARSNAAGVVLDIPGAVNHALQSGLRALCACIAFAALILVVPRYLAPRGAAALAVVLVAGHLASEAGTLFPLVSRGVFQQPSAILTPLLPKLAAATPGQPRPRVFVPFELADLPHGSTPLDLASATHERSADNSGIRHGLAYIPGYAPAQSSRWFAFWDSTANVPVEALWDLLDIAYASAPAHLADGLGLPILGKPVMGRVLLDNQQRRPRAFVASAWRWLPRDEDIRVLMLGREGPDLTMVRLSGDGNSSQGSRSPAQPRITPCEIFAASPERVELHCAAKDSGFAVLADAWAPGWTATVDEKPEPIERADLLLRAVRVAAGEHRIVFSYRTPGLRAGAAAALAAWLLWGALLWMMATRWRPAR